MNSFSNAMPAIGRRLVFLATVVALLLRAPASTAQIPRIEEPVTTAFGTYVPPQVEVAPDAAWYVVEPGMGNVINKDHFNLSPEGMALLEQQAFFVSLGRDPLYSAQLAEGTAYQNFADVYTEAEEFGVPSFVTTDTMLHVFHRLFDHTLKTTEEEFLAAEVAELAQNLLAGLISIYDSAAADDVNDVGGTAGAGVDSEDEAGDFFAS